MAQIFNIRKVSEVIMKQVLVLLLASTVFSNLSFAYSLTPQNVCDEVGRTSFSSTANECDQIVNSGYYSIYGLDLCQYIAEQGAGSIANRCL